MKKLVLALALSVMVSPALAGGHYFHIFKPPVHHAAVASPKPVGNGGTSNWTICPTPAGILICAVTVAIVVDEVRRSMDGPACASGKLTRKSYFGMVIDEPKLWRPLCNFKA